MRLNQIKGLTVIPKQQNKLILAAEEEAFISDLQLGAKQLH